MVCELGEVAPGAAFERRRSEGVADAEVGGDELAGLHPAEDPGDGAEVFRCACAALASALGGAGADAGVFEFGDGCGLFEVGEGVGVVDDVFAVEGVGGGGDLVEGGFPLGEDFAGEVGDVSGFVRRQFLMALEDGVGAGEGVEGGGDHEFEVALGED